MGPRSPAPPAAASPLRQSQSQSQSQQQLDYTQAQNELSRDDTVIRRRPASYTDTESLLTYRTSIDGSDDGRSETF